MIEEIVTSSPRIVNGKRLQEPSDRPKRGVYSSIHFHSNGFVSEVRILLSKWIFFQNILILSFDGFHSSGTSSNYRSKFHRGHISFSNQSQ